MKCPRGCGLVTVVLDGAGAAIVFKVKSPAWYIPVARVGVVEFGVGRPNSQIEPYLEISSFVGPGRPEPPQSSPSQDGNNFVDLLVGEFGPARVALKIGIDILLSDV